MSTSRTPPTASVGLGGAISPLQTSARKGVIAPGNPSPQPRGEDKENPFHTLPAPAFGKQAKPLSRRSPPWGAHQNWGTRVCADDLAEVRQSIQLRRRGERTLVLVRVPDGEVSLGRRGYRDWGGGPRTGPPARGGRRELEGPTLSASSRGAARPQVPGVEAKGAHAARRLLGGCGRRTRPDAAPQTTAGPAEPTKVKGGSPRAPPGPTLGAANGAEKPARCPHCLAAAAGGEGAHLRSPPGAEAGGAGAQRRAVPRGRRTRLPSPRHQQPPQQPQQRTRLSGGRGLHCSPRRRRRAALRARPRARGHMLRRRLGRSDPRRGPARPRPWTAGRPREAPAVPSSLRRPRGGVRTGRLLSQGEPGPWALGHREGRGLDRGQGTPQARLNAWGLWLLRCVHWEAYVGQEPQTISPQPTGCKSGPWYLDQPETNGRDPDPRGSFAPQSPPTMGNGIGTPGSGPKRKAQHLFVESCTSEQRH